MSELQNTINNFRTIISQNAALVEQADKLASIIGQHNTSEIEQGRVLVADAITSLGGSAQATDTLSSLASQIKKLNLLLNNFILPSYAKKPISLSYYMANTNVPIETIEDGTITRITGRAFENNKHIKSVVLKNAKTIGDTSFIGCSSLTYLSAPNVTSTGTDSIRECKKIEEIYMPNLLEIGSYATHGSSDFLKKMNVLNLEKFSNYCLRGSDNLIHLTIGKGFKTNMSFSSASYNPFVAASTTSSSLVEEGETFSSNNEKWNHNIREYFVANLPDRTGMDALTITFGATVLGYMEEATIAAFNAKNWTLA